MQCEIKFYQHWSDKQDSQLVKLLLHYGRQWEMLQRTYFPDFNIKQMKNKFQYLARTALDQKTMQRIRSDGIRGEQREEQTSEGQETTPVQVSVADSFLKFLTLWCDPSFSTVFLFLCKSKNVELWILFHFFLDTSWHSISPYLPFRSRAVDDFQVSLPSSRFLLLPRNSSDLQWEATC